MFQAITTCPLYAVRHSDISTVTTTSTEPNQHLSQQTRSTTAQSPHPTTAPRWHKSLQRRQSLQPQHRRECRQRSPCPSHLPSTPRLVPHNRRRQRPTKPHSTARRPEPSQRPKKAQSQVLHGAVSQLHPSSERQLVLASMRLSKHSPRQRCSTSSTQHSTLAAA